MSSSLPIPGVGDLVIPKPKLPGKLFTIPSISTPEVNVGGVKIPKVEIPKIEVPNPLYVL
jgi:hypothetical protein